MHCGDRKVQKHVLAPHERFLPYLARKFVGSAKETQFEMYGLNHLSMLNWQSKIYTKKQWEGSNAKVCQAIN